MPLVTVDIIEIITIMAMIFLVALIMGLVTMYLFMPAPARNIFKGKWLKRGNRNYTAILNEDNVVNIKIGRPQVWGNKVGKDHFLNARGLGDLVNKKAILGGTGIPFYCASSRVGVVTSPAFIHALEELASGKVKFTMKNLRPKEEICPECGKGILKHVEA